jgi:hypothetical protein
MVARAACGSGGCPTIFAEDDGNVVVQGYVVNAHEAGVQLPEGELLVRIPRNLLHEGATALR